LKNIPEVSYGAIGATCRMMNRGFIVPDDYWKKILGFINDRIEKYYKKTIKNIVVETPDADADAVPLIDPVEAKMGSIYLLFDELIDSIIDGARQWKKPKITVALFDGQLDELIDHYESYKNEIESAYDHTDNDAVEAYDGYSQMTLRRLVQVHLDILEVLNGYKIKRRLNRKNSNSKNSKNKKPIDPIAKLKYLTADKNIPIAVINPSKIINAKKIILFNTHNRSLMVFYALDGNGIQLNGSTLFNFNKKKSSSKNLRKPEIQVLELAGLATQALDKAYAAIKSLPKPVTGRINRHCIIVNCF
jgi:hypothetical protein